MQHQSVGGCHGLSCIVRDFGGIEGSALAHEYTRPQRGDNLLRRAARRKHNQPDSRPYSLNFRQQSKVFLNAGGRIGNNHIIREGNAEDGAARPRCPPRRQTHNPGPSGYFPDSGQRLGSERMNADYDETGLFCCPGTVTQVFESLLFPGVEILAMKSLQQECLQGRAIMKVSCTNVSATDAVCLPYHLC